MLGLFKPYEYIMESRCKQERLNASCMTSAIALMQERENTIRISATMQRCQESQKKLGLLLMDNIQMYLINIFGLQCPIDVVFKI